MNKYLAFFKITIEEYFVYRLNMIMWRMRQILVFLIPFFIWKAIVGSGGEIYGYTFASLMTYLFGTTILRSLVMGSRTSDLGWMINSGYLTIPLMRPVGMFRFLFVRDLADKLFNLSFMFLEIPLIMLIFKPPVFLQSNLVVLLFFLLSTFFSMLIYFYINIIFGSFAFWSRDVWAPRFLLMVILEFTTGAMLPLDMLPRLVQDILYLTPFPHLLFTPLTVYLNGDLASGISSLFTQLGWVITLGFLTIFLWQKGIKSYEAEGR